MRSVLTVLGISLTLGLARQAPAPLSAPSPDFVRLFTQYRTGDADAAVAEFASWDRARVQREAARDIPGDDLRAKAALALFHTEAGIRNGELDLVVGQDSSGRVLREPHGTSAGTIVDAIRPKALAAHDDPMIEFVRTWTIVQASVAMRWDRDSHVTPISTPHGAPLEDDPEWMVVRGAWIEKHVGPEVMEHDRVSYSSNPVGFFGDQPSDAMTTEHGVFDAKRVQQAEGLFRDGLKRDPSLSEARLRLGHLYALVNRQHDAAKELEAAFFAASDPPHTFVRYLAALFLGRVFEEERDVDKAEQMYRAAIEAESDPASAHLALASLELRTGRAEDGWHDAKRLFGDEAANRSSAADPVSLYPDAAFWQVPAKLRALRQLVRP